MFKEASSDIADNSKSADTAEIPPAAEPASVTKEPTWFEALQANDDDAFKKAVAKQLNNIVAKYGMDNYSVLLLFDEVDSITNYHSDRLYAAASRVKDTGKDILLILQSNGGRIEPAYLASKTLKRLARSKFAVTVPRRAKSAATLLALGADEIHMGMLSQLGPIDPQLYGLPVLALGNAIDVIADLTCRFPGASEMLTKYLTDQAPIRLLGYYQRVGESAVQYAERLLAGKTLAEGKTPEIVAKHLVNHYKDHDFVIDFDEAKGLLGQAIVKQGTPEYALADEVYKFLDMVGLLLSMRNRQFWYVGDTTDYIATRNTPPDKS